MITFELIIRIWTSESYQDKHNKLQVAFYNIGSKGNFYKTLYIITDKYLYPYGKITDNIYGKVQK